MSAKRRIEGPRWKIFFAKAWRQLAESAQASNRIAADNPAFIDRVAQQIVTNGDGPAFLKAARRGRPTERQNIRYQLLREVERRAGDQVKRRRPANNIPDALALKPATAREGELFP